MFEKVFVSLVKKCVKKGKVDVADMLVGGVAMLIDNTIEFAKKGK